MMSQNLDYSSQLVSPEEQMALSTPPASLYNETHTSFHLLHFNPRIRNELDQTTPEVFPKTADFPASNHKPRIENPLILYVCDTAFLARSNIEAVNKKRGFRSHQHFS